MRSCSCSLSTIACGAVYKPWPLRPGSGLACRPNRAHRNSLRPEGGPWTTPLRRAASGHGCIAMLRLGCRAVCTALAPEAPARCSARSSRVGRPREPGIARSLAAPPRRKQRSALVRLLRLSNPRRCVAGGMPARSPASCALCKWREASVGTPKDHHHTCLVCVRLRLCVWKTLQMRELGDRRPQTTASGALCASP